MPAVSSEQSVRPRRHSETGARPPPLGLHIGRVALVEAVVESAGYVNVVPLAEPVVVVLLVLAHEK